MAKVTLEQWRMLHAVVEHGGFAQAAEALHKSQSTISYSVNKLQRQLDVQILEIKGRKAVLTDAGLVLLRRSESLLKDSEALEKAAESLAQGWEANIILAYDAVFPSCALIECLKQMPSECNTRIELVETVLSGTNEMLFSGEADLVITGTVPQGFLGEPLLHFPFLPVARFDHPLNQSNQVITNNVLKGHRQVVIRDSGAKRVDAGWLGAESRLTISNIATAIEMVKEGLGFAWFPELDVREDIESGLLKVINLESKDTRHIQTHLIIPDKDFAGPATLAFAEAIKKQCKQ